MIGCWLAVYNRTTLGTGTASCSTLHSCSSLSIVPGVHQHFVGIPGYTVCVTISTLSTFMTTPSYLERLQNDCPKGCLMSFQFRINLNPGKEGEGGSVHSD